MSFLRPTGATLRVMVKLEPWLGSGGDICSVGHPRVVYSLLRSLCFAHKLQKEQFHSKYGFTLQLQPLLQVMS